MIKAQVFGNVGKQPEQKQVHGTEVLSFSVASNRKVKGEETTQWVRCDWWRPEGPMLKHMTQGSRVVVYGDLSVREYNGKPYLDMRVDSVNFMPGGKSDGSKREAAPADTGGGYDDADYGDSGGDDGSIPF